MRGAMARDGRGRFLAWLPYHPVDATAALQLAINRAHERAIRDGRVVTPTTPKR